MGIGKGRTFMHEFSSESSSCDTLGCSGGWALKTLWLPQRESLAFLMKSIDSCGEACACIREFRVCALSRGRHSAAWELGMRRERDGGHAIEARSEH